MDLWANILGLVDYTGYWGLGYSCGIARIITFPPSSREFSEMNSTFLIAKEYYRPFMIPTDQLYLTNSCAETRRPKSSPLISRISFVVRSVDGNLKNYVGIICCLVAIPTLSRVSHKVRESRLNSLVIRKLITATNFFAKK